MRQFKDWTEAVKSKDSALNELKKSKQKLDLPSVRKLSKIDLEKQKTETSKPAAKATSPPKAKIKDDRIKSTDYRKWDKYDPDEEIGAGTVLSGSWLGNQRPRNQVQNGDIKAKILHVSILLSNRESA